MPRSRPLLTYDLIKVGNPTMFTLTWVPVLMKGEVHMLNNLLKYNLQFFAENEETEVEESSSDSSDDSVDVGALADLVSEKDKEIQQLKKDMEEQKKINAQLLVKVNSQSQPATQKKTFDENLLDLVGAKPRKE